MRTTIITRHWARTLCLCMAASVTAAGAVEAHAGFLPKPLFGKGLSPRGISQKTSAPTNSTAQPTSTVHPGNNRDFLLQLRPGTIMNIAELRKIATAAGARVTLTRRLPGNEYTIRLNPGVASTDLNTMVSRLEGDSNILLAEALTPNSGLINGQLRALRLSSDPGQIYSVYVPKKGGANAPILVAIGNFSAHLTGRSGDGVAMAEKYGAVVLIPQFTPGRFANYSRLDPYDKAGGADAVLGKIVAEAGKMAGAKTDKFYLLGYGSGGEFAHRYAMAHPGQTAGVVTINAASFTLPDMTQSYPAGIKPGSLPPGITMDPAQFLKVPALAMATDLPATKGAPRPVYPGYNNYLSYYPGFPYTFLKPGAKVPPGLLKKAAITARPNVLASRAQAWINAMNAAAKTQNLSTLYGYKLISYCPGISCIGHDGIVDAFTFLFEGKLPAAPTPTPPAGHTLVVNAGANQTVAPGSAVTLHGTVQQTGTPSNLIVTQWIQIGGPAVVLTGANTPTATFTAPMATTTTPVSSSGLVLTFKYTVIDSLGYARAAITHVTLKPASPATGTPAPEGSTTNQGGSTTNQGGSTTNQGSSTTNLTGGTNGSLNNSVNSSVNASNNTSTPSGGHPVMGTVVQGGDASKLPIGAR
jgi:pimeloyl-ACP methyl ester carboxylesterase